MSLQEIKEKLATFSRKDQDEVIAFLFHLRHANDADYQRDLAKRLQDQDPLHWLSPDEFQRKLDEKESH